MPLPVQVHSKLPVWTAQLAGILPLTALVEFIDVPSKLHSFELTASVPLWNWPVTPAGARLLLSSEDNIDACCLDSVGRSSAFHCMDGRYGDLYPSSAPATARLCAQTRERATTVRNDSPNMKAKRGRKQRLNTIVLTRLPGLPQSRLATYLSSQLSPFFYSKSIGRINSHSVAYTVTSAFGWICWTGATVVTFMAGLWIAAAFLALMPLTGLTVSFTHGNTPRRLVDNRPAEFNRLIVATDSVNGSNWWAFYGGSHTLNSLLNKPLYRVNPVPSWRPLARMLLRLLIAGQWVLGVVSCAFQDWNALVIFIWLMFCVFFSAYVHPSRKCVQDWLKYNCRIGAARIEAEFSTRISMLTALVYLNPDSKEKRTKWINPILQSDDRREWETALFNYISTGTRPLVIAC